VIPGSPATASLRYLLTALAESGSTGALHIGGAPGGTLYLVAGRITYAESPASPGIGDRLVTSGRLPAAAWRRAYADGAAGCRVGRLLVARGLLGRNELACRVVAAICDATHALLQSDDEAPVRFAPGEQHPFGVVAQVELAALSHETARRLRAVPAPRRAGRPFTNARPPIRRVSQIHSDAHAVRQPAASCAQDGRR
jgi:Domain of unknown function (DUF4388)